MPTCLLDSHHPYPYPTPTSDWPRPPSNWSSSCINTGWIPATPHSHFTTCWRWNRHSVPKRRLLILKTPGKYPEDNLSLFHFTCQIKLFSSLSPTWKVIPLMSTWMTLLHPKTYPLLSSSGYCPINYIILPLSFWHAVPSAHPPHRIHIWHCPSISVLLAWYYIPQTQ